MIAKLDKGSIQKIGIYVNKNKKTMSAIKKELGCQYILNAGLYNMTTFKPVNTLIVDGEKLSSGGNPYGYAIKDNKVTFSYDNNVNAPTFISAYPVLVRNGAATGDAAPTGLDGYRPRSCMGVTNDGSLVLMCDQTNRSLGGIAGDMIDAGCVTAINLDGGGSSQADFNGKALNSLRIVHNYICVWTKTEKPSNTTNSKYKVCIDPGHSSSESNGSPDGTYKEHEFALDVGKRIKAILERHNVQVVMTREDGSEVSLSKRCQISNDNKCDLFVSLHTNADSSTGWSTANGWEAYICAKGGNAEKLAEAIRAETIQTIGCVDRGVKVNASLVVVKDTVCPAVLVEHGFHTNQQEVAKLKSSDYRQKYAEADAKGILKILGIAYKAETPGKDEPPVEAPQPSEFETARQWAISQKITDGSNPEKAVTRAELWAMLYRMDNR